MGSWTLKLRWFASGIAVALLAGCANIAPRSAENRPDQLPGLPTASQDHSGAVVENDSINGADAIDMSSGAEAAGNSLNISAAGSSDFEWAIYRYTPPQNATPL